jgi:hypothetical protein
MGYLTESEVVDVQPEPGISSGRFLQSDEIVDVAPKDPGLLDRLSATPATAAILGGDFLKGATFNLLGQADNIKKLTGGLVDLSAPNARKFLDEKGLEPWGPAQTVSEIAGSVVPAGAIISKVSPLVKAAYPAVAGTIKGGAATAGLSGMLYSAVDSAVKGKPIMEGLRDMGYDGLTWTAQTALLDKAIRFVKGWRNVPEPNREVAVKELSQAAEERLMPTVGPGPPEGIVRQNVPLKGGRIPPPAELSGGRLVAPQEVVSVKSTTTTYTDPIIERSATKVEPSFTENLPSTDVVPVEQPGPMPLIRRDEGFARGLGQGGSISSRLMADIGGTGTGAAFGAASDPESPTRGALAGGAIGLGLAEGGRAGFNFTREHGMEAIKKFFNPLKGLPGENEYLDLRNMTKGNVHRTENIIDRVSETVNKFDEPTRIQMFDFLDGKIPASQLPQQAQTTAQNLRTMNNLIGKMLVKRGMMSEETFLANKDKYIRYMYAKHILNDAGVELPPSSGKMDLSYLIQRQDIPESVRKAIGQIKDIAIAEPVSVGKPLHDMVRFDMLKNISDDPRWTWQPPKVSVGNTTMKIGDLKTELEAQQRVAQAMPHVPEVQARLGELENAMTTASQVMGNPPEGFVKMPETKSWGPLAGQFVRKEVYRDVVPMTMGFQDPGQAGKLINTAIMLDEKAVALFKVGKTALNIPTIARNNVSNVIQLNMSGIPIQDIPKYAVKGIRHWLAGDEVYGQALRHGLFKSNWTQGEINEVLKTMETTQNTSDMIFNKVSDLAKYYGKVDDIWKLVKFTEQIENGVDFKTAAREANKWVMDYSLVHPAISAARKHIMPFVTYQYKALPLIAETIRDRPFSMLKYFLIAPALYETAKQTMNFTEQDFRQLKKKLPLFIKENQNYVPLPVKSPEGNVQWVNMEYFFPWQMIMGASRDVHSGAVGELVSDVGISNPIAELTYSVAKLWRGEEPPRDPFTGKRIFNNLDSPTEKTFKMAEYVYNKWAPSMLSRYGALGTSAKYATDQEDRYGKKVSLPQAAGKWVGVNIVSPTPLQTNKEMISRVMQNKSDLNSIIKDNTVPIEKKKDAIRRYHKQIKNIYGVEGE